MSSPEMPREEGHDRLYRLTATGGKVGAETKYYLDAHSARGWRDRLREAGYEAHAAWVPASAFTAVSDEELDRLAAEEESRA